MRSLIVTADDFGRSVEVNEAVEDAFRRGILTAASLMVAAPAADDAVRRAKRLEGLGVGLHLTLVDGAPLLDAATLPDLLGADGRLPADPLSAGLRLALQRRLHRQAAAEIGAQFEAFRRTGLPLDHVNGHHHYHQHPVVFRVILELARRYGFPGVRVPYEPLRASFAAFGDRFVSRLGNAITLRHRTGWMKRRLRATGLAYNDALFGLADSGRMDRERVLAVLMHLPPGVSELYCHPATHRWAGPDAPPAAYRPEAEYQALIDPEVVAAARQPSIRRICFTHLR